MDVSHRPELCPRFHRASELIGSRWTGAIIYVLLRARCRFATLRDAIPDITDRMLSERLHELEQEGIVVRTVVPEAPVRVEYELTKKGRALASAFDAIAHWAEKWVTVDELPAGGPAGQAGRAAAGRSTRRGRAGSRSMRKRSRLA
jgi:DNA-binding HxlR family transcriptional regulator